MTQPTREEDEADLDALRAHVKGRAVPHVVKRRLMRVRDADIRHDPTAARFWAEHPLTKGSD